MSLAPVSNSIFYHPQDPADQRLSQFVTKTTLPELKNNNFSWTLLGYPDDEGILLNAGRPGAKDAPDLIRTYLYKMTPNIDFKSVPRLADLGNLIPNKTLADRHAQAREIVNTVLSSNSKLISLGGGHDYGFPDAAGFLDFHLKNEKNSKPIVINFDAHLDVRPTQKGFHSGTPFRRLLEEFKGQFDFVEVGIQPQCNNQTHLHWAQEQGALVFNLETIENMGLLNTLTGALDTDPTRPLWLSVDIDAFSSNEAPGCSQSWTTGITIQKILPALKYFSKNFNLNGMGLYEVSPPLDQDNRTSKLAALLIYHLIL